MKKYLLFVVLMGLGLLLGGCRTAYTVDGKPCQPIGKSDEEKLVARARTVLLSNKSTKFLMPSERTDIGRGLPEIKVEYGGDRFGVAMVTWELPRKTVTVSFNGHLPDTNSIYSRVIEKQDDIIFADKENAKQEETAKKRPARYRNK